MFGADRVQFVFCAYTHCVIGLDQGNLGFDLSLPPHFVKLFGMRGPNYLLENRSNGQQQQLGCDGARIVTV